MWWCCCWLRFGRLRELEVVAGWLAGRDTCRPPEASLASPMLPPSLPAFTCCSARGVPARGGGAAPADAGGQRAADAGADGGAAADLWAGGGGAVACGCGRRPGETPLACCGPARQPASLLLSASCTLRCSRWRRDQFLLTTYAHGARGNSETVTSWHRAWRLAAAQHPGCGQGQCAPSLR